MVLKTRSQFRHSYKSFFMFLCYVKQTKKSLGQTDGRENYLDLTTLLYFFPIYKFW